MNPLAEWTKRRERVLVMGILNATPDSFHDSGRFASPAAAVDAALQMEREGADLIDLGGESTRPGSEAISADEELSRIAPVLHGIRTRSEIPISIDTTKAAVAREALAAGASMINDVSALRSDDAMAETVARAGCFVVLMHMQGAPRTMQEDPSYEDVVNEVSAFLADRTRTAIEAGVPANRIWIDPGIGFGKRLDHNLTLLRNLDRLRRLGSPVLVGLSRKSFLGRILDLPSTERLEGTIAANAVAIVNGADIIRVHDVKEGRRTADVAFRLRDDGV